MNNCTLEVNKRHYIFRKLYKTMQKVFELHDKGTFTPNEYKNKLKSLKAKLAEEFENLKILETRIANLSQIPELNFFICEYLCYHNYMNTARLYAQKHNIMIDFDFYVNFHQIQAEVKAGKNDQIHNFFNTNKINLKGFSVKIGKNDISSKEIENLIRITNYLNCVPEDKNQAIEYLRGCEQQDIDQIKRFLPALVYDDEYFYRLNTNFNFDLFDCFKTFYFRFYNLSMIARLEKRVAIGIVAFGTKLCNKQVNVKCPTCLVMFSQLKSYLPQCKRSTSVILCKGSNELISESNRPYLFDSGMVYCENYIKTCNYNYVCKVTGVVCKKNPRLLYFM